MTDKVLSDLYFSLDSTAGYGGVQRLYSQAKKVLPNLRKSQVEKFLQKYDAYTLHRPVRWQYSRNKTLVDGPGVQYQIDLLDMQRYKKQNDGFRYILTCIDCFSRYAWGEPVKTKSGEETARAFNAILRKAPTPNVVQCDNGLEFYNSVFKKLLKERRIHMFSTDSPTKASIVERFHRTLRSRLQRYFTHKNTHRWTDVIQKVLNGYNKSYHRSIKTSPADVNLETMTRVRDALFAGSDRHAKPKFNVGDQVRISQARRLFKKGYEAGWTGEYFEISKVLPKRDPPVYKLKDLQGEQITGVFYPHELGRVHKRWDDVYRVDKVLKTVKGQAHVSWVGWPSKYNSWIPINTLKRLQGNST